MVDRKKIEVSRERTLEFLESVDSLCCSDEHSSIKERNRVSMMSISDQSTSISSDNLMELRCLDPLAPFEVISRSDGFISEEIFDNLVKSRSSEFTKDCMQYSHGNEGNDKHGMSSVSHRHGLFKFESRKDGSFFEFSVESPEGSYVARTWKADNSLSWIYTFHSLHSGRKGNANGWWFKDNSKQATAVGKMLVSYSRCTKAKETGAFIDSMVTEFVLYDADQSRRSSWGPVVLNETMEQVRFPHLLRDAEMRPELEIGAIVIQVPFNTTESLKLKDSKTRKINVVFPAGIHGSPTSNDALGPSPLLKRWRTGGVCDCGGWDMACALDVYGNPDSLMDHAHPGMLFDQGRRGGPLAFSMHAVEDGKYAVNFHAKLSALQAFSICIAFLHSVQNNSTMYCQDKGRDSLHNDSLKIFSEEIANLMDAVAEGEDAEEEHFEPKTAMKQAIPALALHNFLDTEQNPCIKLLVP